MRFCAVFVECETYLIRGAGGGAASGELSAPAEHPAIFELLSKIKTGSSRAVEGQEKNAAMLPPPEDP